MEPAEGAVIAGKYRLVGPIARGGMGMVWTAQHVALGTRLAVKFVDPTFAKNPAFLARFEREARAAALIESPHVVHVQDFGVEDGTPYLVMELLQGEDLGARLRGQRRLSLAEAARILSQAGHALRRAHERGIIHRDLKPANLFLARVYDQEIVKILDFGIAKQTGAPVGEATTTGEVIGSPHYMGPEQARADKDIDHRSDLWSVGVLVYRMVTGVVPFPGDVMGAILAKVFVEPPPPVASIAPDLPPELDAFFARALAKQREHRFQTIDELVAAFHRIAERYGELPSGARRSLPDVSLPAVSPALAPAPIAAEVGRVSFVPTPVPISSTPAPASFAPAQGPGSLTPAPGPASVSSTSIATGVASVRDAAITPAAGRRRGAQWLAPVAAVLLLAAGGLTFWLAGSPASPAADSADPAPGTASPTSPPTVVAPAVTPAEPVASGPPPAPPPNASTSAPAAEPPAPGTGAGAGPQRDVSPSPPRGAPTTGTSTAKTAAPAPTRKGTTTSDEWGF